MVQVAADKKDSPDEGVLARCTGHGQALLEQSERDEVHATLETATSNEWSAGELPDQLHAGRKGPMQGLADERPGSKCHSF